MHGSERDDVASLRVASAHAVVLSVMRLGPVVRGVLTTVLSVLPVFAFSTSYQDFIGTWRLISHTIDFKSGDSVQVSHSNAVIMYAPDNHMCYVGADPSRPAVQSSSKTSEIIEAFNGVSSYCAQVEFDEEASLVRHQVLVDKVKQREGHVRVRYYSFRKDDQLVLKVAEEELHSTVENHVIVWERIR